MIRCCAAVVGLLLFVGMFFVLPITGQSLSRNLTMTCIECHADPAAGGVHGGFRALTDQTNDQIDVICVSCHDGSYRNPQGVDAPEAIVHQGSDTRGEFGTWKAGCLDCHNNHYDLLSGDGVNRNLKMLGLLVKEASSTDGLARIRKPIINDVNGDNGGSGNKRFEDDVQAGWECHSGIPDDSTCDDHGSLLPSEDDDVRKLIFFLNITSNGDNWAAANSALDPPYNGSCNTCHTRTGHHRRDTSGGDHTHNISRNCDDCHNHKDGWTNKGG